MLVQACFSPSITGIQRKDRKFPILASLFYSSSNRIGIPSKNVLSTFTHTPSSNKRIFLVRCDAEENGPAKNSLSALDQQLEYFSQADAKTPPKDNATLRPMLRSQGPIVERSGGKAKADEDWPEFDITFFAYLGISLLGFTLISNIVFYSVIKFASK